jgi:hypothetical protein
MSGFDVPLCSLASNNYFGDYDLFFVMHPLEMAHATRNAPSRLVARL